jgi:hypothetical protein
MYEVECAQTAVMVHASSSERLIAEGESAPVEGWIQRDGPFVSHAERILVQAIKPV